jgi:hypothetical protein
MLGVNVDLLERWTAIIPQASKFMAWEIVYGLGSDSNERFVT